MPCKIHAQEVGGLLLLNDFGSRARIMANRGGQDSRGNELVATGMQTASANHVRIQRHLQPCATAGRAMMSWMLRMRSWWAFNFSPALSLTMGQGLPRCLEKMEDHRATANGRKGRRSLEKRVRGMGCVQSSAAPSTVVFHIAPQKIVVLVPHQRFFAKGGKHNAPLSKLQELYGGVSGRKGEKAPVGTTRDPKECGSAAMGFLAVSRRATMARNAAMQITSGVLSCKRRRTAHAHNPLADAASLSASAATV